MSDAIAGDLATAGGEGGATSSASRARTLAALDEHGSESGTKRGRLCSRGFLSAGPDRPNPPSGTGGLSASFRSDVQSGPDRRPLLILPGPREQGGQGHSLLPVHLAPAAMLGVGLVEVTLKTLRDNGMLSSSPVLAPRLPRPAPWPRTGVELRAVEQRRSRQSMVSSNGDLNAGDTRVP